MTLTAEQLVQWLEDLSESHRVIKNYLGQEKALAAASLITSMGEEIAQLAKDNNSLREASSMDALQLDVAESDLGVALTDVAILSSKVDAISSQIEKAKGLLKGLSDDLACEVAARYPVGIRKRYPHIEHKYQRDMYEVIEARAFLATLEQATEQELKEKSHD